MPEFTVKEVRLPELHLPEIKRDEIVRALSGLHVPEVDRAIAEPRRRLRDIDLRDLARRRRDLSGIDAGKLIAAAVTAAQMARPAPKRARWSPFRRSRWSAVSRSRDSVVAMVRPAPRRSRRRVIVIVALAAAAGWVLFRSPAFRARIDGTTAAVRRMIADRRSASVADVDLETGEPVAVTTPDDTVGQETLPETVAATDVTEGAANPA
jgi:hypothetical protein